MKSRTSSCKWAAFKKDLSRFWPVWVGYLLFLTLFQVILCNDDLSYWYAANVGESISVMGVFNGIYALIVAQMLFGDLFNPRMCNGAHSLPLRREEWFGVHIAAGFLFCLIPTALMAGFSEIIIQLYSSMIDSWQLPLYWFIGTNIQYIFFYGLAVFCVMCAGNRFGGTIIYGIANFGSLLVYLLVDQLYTPLLKGVVTLSGPFEKLSPMLSIVNQRFINADRTETGRTILHAPGIEEREYIGTFEVTPEGWRYIAIAAVVGIVLLVLARVMYKRRQLEVAGDFLAVRWLEPVFQVVFTLFCGSGFHAVFLLFFGLDTEFVYLIFGIGILAGWFAGRMLLERSTRVFRLKTVGGFLLMAAAVALSLFITHLDPLGIETWVPEQADLKGATISTRYQSTYSTEDPAEIADLLRLHEIALTENVSVHPDYDSDFYNPDNSDPEAARISLIYHLTNGLTAFREYYVLAEGEGGEIIRKYFTQLDVVIPGSDIQDLDDLRHELKDVEYVSLNGREVGEKYLTKEFLLSLADAIAADCEAGNMVQLGVYHPEPILVLKNDTYDLYNLNLEFQCDDDRWIYMNIYADCENILAVLEPTGVLEEVRTAYENGIG